MSLKSDFDKFGYVAIRSFLDTEEVAELRSATRRFLELTVPGLPSEVVYFEDKGDPATLKQVQKINEYEPYFDELTRSAGIESLAEELLDGSVTLQNTQYFNKIPRLGKATPPHQDGYYFMIKPQAAITMWLSLGHADAANGAVCYVNGSHKEGIRPHGSTGTLGFSQGISDWTDEDETQCVQMQAGPGDLLVHHSLTIHKANNNESECDRKAIGFIYYRDDVDIDEVAHATYQDRLNQSLKARGRI